MGLDETAEAYAGLIEAALDLLKADQTITPTTRLRIALAFQEKADALLNRPELAIRGALLVGRLATYARDAMADEDARRGTAGDAAIESMRVSMTRQLEEQRQETEANVARVRATTAKLSDLKPE